MTEKFISVNVAPLIDVKNIAVKTGQNINNVTTTKDLSSHYSKLAEQWAHGEGLVEGVDYSSKTYAGVAQEAAESAQGSADTAQAFVNDFSGVVDNAITEIDGVKTEALTAVTSSKDLALSDISATQSSALTEIGDLKNSSLTEISASSTTALGNINNVGQNYIDNINATGKGYDNLTHRQITNCLLEVPQRIKYDLTDGVLTIKKGSQVIVPYGTSGGDFTVVGSPTIVDGVASGFSDGNYITIPMFDVTKSNYRVDCVCNYATGTGQNFFLGGAWNVGPYRFAIISNLNKLALYMGTDGTSWNIASLQYGKTILENNTPYKVSFIRENGSAYKVVLKNLSTNIETTEITVSSTEDLVNNINAPIHIGYSGWSAFAGSIDLKQFSITVDDKVVYRPYIQKGDRFLHDNFKVADTQFADGKFFVWAELVNGFTHTSTTGNENIYNRVLSIKLTDGSFCTNVQSYSTNNPSYTVSVQYYDTEKNECWHTSQDGTPDYRVSLPVLRITSNTATAYAEVSDVFNGMGYIGSTVWVDKGVKGLIPNGRNEDGSLNNIEYTTDKIYLETNETIKSWEATLSFTLDHIGNDGNYYPIVWDTVYHASPTQPASFGLWYDTINNKMYAKRSTIFEEKAFVFGTITFTDGVISNFQPKQPILVADIQDVVRKTGDTMSGALELYGTSSYLGLFGGAIYTHTMDLSLADTPSGNKYYAIIQHEDKNMVRKNRLESFWMTDGRHGVQLSERKNATDNSYFNITIGVDANGNAYTYAPHCAVNNGIVTQAGLSKAGNGYMKFGNGIIIQWGVTGTLNAANSATVTLPTAFSSTNYKVTGSALYAENKYATTGINSLTKTSFKLMNISGAGGSCPFHWLAIGY